MEVIGGVNATVAKAKQYLDNGDLRFAAELASHAVFAAPEDSAARELLASVLERLGYGAENATWRNCSSGSWRARPTAWPSTVTPAC